MTLYCCSVASSCAASLMIQAQKIFVIFSTAILHLHVIAIILFCLKRLWVVISCSDYLQLVRLFDLLD
jgi:hypothetical protein